MSKTPPPAPAPTDWSSANVPFAGPTPPRTAPLAPGEERRSIDPPDMMIPRLGVLVIGLFWPWFLAGLPELYWGRPDDQASLVLIGVGYALSLTFVIAQVLHRQHMRILAAAAAAGFGGSIVYLSLVFLLQATSQGWRLGFTGLFLPAVFAGEVAVVWLAFRVFRWELRYLEYARFLRLHLQTRPPPTASAAPGTMVPPTPPAGGDPRPSALSDTPLARGARQRAALVRAHLRRRRAPAYIAALAPTAFVIGWIVFHIFNNPSWHYERSLAPRVLDWLLALILTFGLGLAVVRRTPAWRIGFPALNIAFAAQIAAVGLTVAFTGSNGLGPLPCLLFGSAALLCGLCAVLVTGWQIERATLLQAIDAQPAEFDADQLEEFAVASGEWDEGPRPRPGSPRR